MSDIILIMPTANRYDTVSLRVPNGLLAVAAVVSREGYDVKIIDMKIDNNWQNTLKDSIGPSTICAGITCSTGRMIDSALKVASCVRDISPELPIVWGGPHPTLLPEQTLENPLVDIVVINEGDYIFYDLVKALSGNGDLSGVKGIGFKENGHIKINPPAALVENLDELPLPPYHLVDVSRYSTLSIDNLPSLDIFSSRGCPYNCGFCSTPVTSKRHWRANSVEYMISNVSLLYEKYGVRTFYFADDNFMVDLKRIDRFLDALKESGMKIYWGTQGLRVDTINRMSPELLDKIESSGCKELSVGVESANPEILGQIEKGINVDDVLRANKKLTGRNFAVKFNMIIGFPGESIKSIEETVKLALRLYKENKNTWFPFNIYTPFPGTPMFKLAASHGFNPPEKLEQWSRLESVGWHKYYGHWLNDGDISLLQSINLTSYLAFPAALQKISNRLMKLLFHLNRPIAYFRFKNMFYRFHIEKRFIPNE